MSAKRYDQLVKLLLVGDSGAGKTSLLRRFSGDAFSPSFVSTIGVDFRIRTLSLGGKTVKLQVWDTAGQERFQSLTRGYYRGAAGILLVYDVGEARSLDSVARWLARIDEEAAEGVERLLVGNKADLERRRVVSTARGAQVALDHGLGFLETSARDDVNVDRAFVQLAQAVLAKLPSGPAPPSPIEPSKNAFPAPFGCC